MRNGAFQAVQVGVALLLAGFAALVGYGAVRLVRKAGRPPTVPSGEVSRAEADEQPDLPAPERVERPGIRGRVVLPPDRVPDEIDVTATPAAGGAVLTTVAKASNGFAFAWTNLRPGLYVVDVNMRPGHPLVTWTRGVCLYVPREVNVGTTMQVVDLEPAADRWSTSLVVRVVDEGGRPLERAEFRVSVERATWRARGDAVSWRRRDGSFVVVFDRPYGHEEGEDIGDETKKILRRRVGVDVPGRGRRIVDILPDGASVEVAMPPPASLEVATPGFPEAAAGARVEAALLPAGEADFWAGKADPAARASFTRLESVRLGPVAPGDYDLELWTEAGAHARTLEKRRVRLEPGANRVEVPLERWAGSLTLDAGAGRKFRFAYLRAVPESEDAPPASSQTDAAGRVVFEWLRPGEYDLELDGETRRVQVKGETRVAW